MVCLFLEFTIIHSKLWDAMLTCYQYLGYMTVSPNQTLLVFEEALKQNETNQKKKIMILG